MSFKFLGMFTMTFGYIIFNIGGLLEVCVNNTEILKFISLSSFGFLQQGLLWWLPTLIIEIWLQAFIEECKVTESIKKNGEYFVDTFEKLESSLKNFLLFFYSASQIYAVVATFLSFSTFLMNTSIELPSILSLFGLLVSILR